MVTIFQDILARDDYGERMAWIVQEIIASDDYGERMVTSFQEIIASVIAPPCEQTSRCNKKSVDIQDIP